MGLLSLSENTRLRFLSVLIALSFALVVVFEVELPDATAVWILFVPIITLTFFLQRPKIPLIVAALCSMWMIFDLVIIESQPVYSILFVRRAIGVFAFFSVGFIVRFAILTSLAKQKNQAALEKSVSDLAKEKVKLERSNGELEQFAGVAAHDLRSPIATIYSWADMLDHLSPPPRTPELDQAMTIIRSNAKKADALIQDVLEIARVNVSISNIVQVNLDRTLSDILVTLQPQIKGTRAQVRVDSLPNVQGNKTYLTSVFSNLIRNALIYHDKKRTPEITVGYLEQVDTYEFFVKDNGIGIDPKFKDRIFDMFKRLHGENEYSGTGIGLAFCKKVVELSGGKIWVDSHPDQGSTFFFTYPKKVLGAKCET